jgi:hypothetical protein
MKAEPKIRSQANTVSANEGCSIKNELEFEISTFQNDQIIEEMTMEHSKS